MVAQAQAQPAVSQHSHQGASLPIGVRLAVLEGRIAKVGSLAYEIFPRLIREPLFTFLKYGLSAALLAVPLVGILAPVKITYLALGALTLAIGLIFVICTLKRGSLDELRVKFLNWSGAGELGNVHFALAAGANLNTRGPGGETALMAAAGGGHLPVIHILLERGANVNETSSDQSTALMSAAGGGHTAALEALIAAGAVVDLQNASGTTALMSAAGGGHTAALEVLIEAGATVNHQNALGTTALMSAVEAGHVEAVDVLLRDPANPAAPHRASRQNGIARRDHSGRTAFEIAAEHGHTEILQTLGRVLRVNEVESRFRLVEDSGDLTQFGLDAIRMAARNGHTATVQALIQLAGAADNILIRAITSAAQHGQEATVRALLEGIRDEERVGYSVEALISAALNRQEALVRTLLQPRFRVALNARAQSDSTMTVMRVALMLNRGIVEELIAHSGDVDAPDAQRRTMLMWAANEGRLGVVQALITAGASVGAVDESGDTALILAARAGHVGTVQALIASSPESQRSDLSREAVGEMAYHGQTEAVLALVRAHSDPRAFGGQALICATLSGEEATVQALLEFGVDINAQGPGDQMTALMGAVVQNSVDIVVELMRRSADPTLVNRNRQTAFDLVVEHGRASLLAAMIEAGFVMSPEQGIQALFKAVERGDGALAQELVRHGISADSTNTTGQTVVRYARSIGAIPTMMEILENRGYIGGGRSAGGASDSGPDEDGQ